MISAAKLKYYASLLQKKYRTAENKFIAEGLKIVEEGLAANYKCDIILIRKDVAEAEPNLIRNFNQRGLNTEVLSSKDFERISDSKSPQGVSAVFHKKELKDKIVSSIIVCLDNISDPGNAGTILRNCDWFGIKQVILSNNTADLFSPKVIRSTMGSVFHLEHLITDDLHSLLLNLKKIGFSIITADMNGESIYNFDFPDKTAIIFSNETHGPSQEILNISDNIITVPAFGKAESLNVAGASAVILSRHAEKKLL